MSVDTTLATELAIIVLEYRAGAKQTKLLREKFEEFSGDLETLVSEMIVMVHDLSLNQFFGKKPTKKDLEGYMQGVLAIYPRVKDCIKAGIAEVLGKSSSGPEHKSSKSSASEKGASSSGVPVQEETEG